jgi:hypothetical protein
MLAQYLGEVVTTAVFLWNWGPMMVMDDKTSFEVYHGHKPIVSFLKMFGCLTFAKDKRPMLKNLDDQSMPMVFFG